MKTLIIGDIHLCTSKNAEDEFLAAWLRTVVEQQEPEHIVFAGDTFELSFCTQNRSKINTPAEILQSILALHGSFFDFLRRASQVKKLTFLVGEHDYFLLKGLDSNIAAFFCQKDVYIGEYFYDQQSRLLAVHGHQFDYNLIPSYDVDEILTDKLTRVFEDFVFQEPEKTRKLLQAFRDQKFSFWYAAGRVPQYLEATTSIFGHDRRVYYQGLSQVLRSDFMKRWLKDLRNPLNKRIGYIAQYLSFLPPALLHRISRVWWALAQKIVKKRALEILDGKIDTTLINIPADLRVDKLVVGHTHHNGALVMTRDGTEKAYYCTSSPRWYVRGIRRKQLELHRDSGFVFIDSDNTVSYFASNEARDIPLTAIS